MTNTTHWSKGKTLMQAEFQPVVRKKVASGDCKGCGMGNLSRWEGQGLVHGIGLKGRSCKDKFGGLVSLMGLLL